jgi:hypothetical protein
MKRLLAALICSVILGCSNLTQPDPGSDNRSLVETEQAPNSQLFIRQVDDGKVILFDQDKKLRTKVWLDPGSYMVALLCRTNARFVDMMPVALQLGIEEGADYLIRRDSSKDTGLRLGLEAIAIPKYVEQ